MSKFNPNGEQNEFLRSIGRYAVDLDQIVELVEGFEGSDSNDKAIAATAFFEAKQSK